MYHKMNTKETDNSMKLRNEALLVTIPVRVGASLAAAIDSKITAMALKNRASYIRELLIKDLIENKS